MSAEPSLDERFRGLAASLPAFESPGFEFGSWPEPKDDEPGGFTMPYFQYGETASAFVQAAYDPGRVEMEFAWVRWKETPEAHRPAGRRNLWRIGRWKGLTLAVANESCGLRTDPTVVWIAKARDIVDGNVLFHLPATGISGMPARIAMGESG
jgi:hypothetical protein